MVTLRVNGKTYQVDAEPGTPLLWVLRDSLGLTGTKYGCGIAQCGACTVHVDGRATRSCVVPLSAVLNNEITTIEGLAADSQHPVQRAWREYDVPQCGYCQSGQIMAAAALLTAKRNPSDSDIDREMTLKTLHDRRLKRQAKIKLRRNGMHRQLVEMLVPLG